MNPNDWPGWSLWGCQNNTPPPPSYNDMSVRRWQSFLNNGNGNLSLTGRGNQESRSEPDAIGWQNLVLLEHDVPVRGPAPAMQASSSSQAQPNFVPRQWFQVPGGLNQNLVSRNDEILGTVGGAAAIPVENEQESSDSDSLESSDEDAEQVYDLDAAYYPFGILRSIRESWPCYVKMLPEKPKLPVGAMLWAYVATCDTPYNFLIKPMYCTNEGLSDYMTDAIYWNYSGHHQVAARSKIALASSMDLSYHGHSGMRLIQRFSTRPENWLLECMRPIFDLEDRLNQFLKFGNRYRDFQRASYEVFQELVAVRDSFGNWHRAVVLVFNEMNEGPNGQLGMLTVRLIDHGYVDVTPMNNACGLPRQFAQMGCYLYTCAASGIVPEETNGLWPKKANEYFRGAVIWQRVFVTVLEQPELEEGHLGPFEYNPYWVRISTSNGFGSLSDAAVKMVRSENAVPFNEYTQTAYPIVRKSINALLMYNIKYDRTARWIESVRIEKELKEKLENAARASSCT